LAITFAWWDFGFYPGPRVSLPPVSPGGGGIAQKSDVLEHSKADQDRITVDLGMTHIRATSLLNGRVLHTGGPFLGHKLRLCFSSSLYTKARRSVSSQTTVQREGSYITTVSKSISLALIRTSNEYNEWTNITSGPLHRGD
jgi:hypothetical protein